MTLRDLPSVEKLAAGLLELPQELAVAVAREAIGLARAALQRGESVRPLDETARALAAARGQRHLRRAINATGVLLHTNLGRATLAPSAVATVAEVAAGHATLEVEAETGGRGDRQRVIAALFRALTGAEDAVVVNNNAAATVLAVAAVASGREVILSRGQLVEIGGHFRLPEVIVQSGAHLVEVGTTNRTRIADYERAITANTGMLLRCHPSNFQVMGFTEEASLAELVALGRERGVVVGDDLGSGALVDFTPYGLLGEDLVQKSVATGADLVWFSGDKLLGGPQAGIVVGNAALIGQVKRHPLMRALRPDKLTLAALEATLRLYLTGKAWEEIPILRRIRRPADDIRAACERVGVGEVVPTISEIGGGSLPGKTLPSWAVALDGDVVALARQLRLAPTPVYGRIEKGRLLLDLRAVDDDEVPLIAAMLKNQPGV